MAVAALLAWLALIATRPGSLFDQTQHAHVAWSLGQGAVLNEDLVDHHMPLWWSIIRTHTWFGVESGVAVLAYARVVVVLLAAALTAVLWRIHAGGTGPGRDRLPTAAMASVMLLTTVAPAFWCSRPEPFALVCLAGAMLAARHAALAGQRRPREILAWSLTGALAALAVAATPRAVFFLGLLPLALPVSAWGMLKRPRPWIVALLGGIIVTGLLLAATELSIEATRWDLRLSRALMHEGAGARTVNLGAIIAVGFAAPVVFLLGAARQHRVATALRFGYCTVVVLITHRAQGEYLWDHSVATIFMAYAFMLAVHFADLSQRAGAVSRWVRTLAPLVVLAAVAWQYQSGTETRREHEQRTALRIGLDEIAQGGVVAIPYRHHPVSARDAIPQVLEHNPATALRLCPAIAKLPEDRPYPACNFVADLQRHEPLLIDANWYDVTLSPPQRAELAGWLHASYENRRFDVGDYLADFWVHRSVLPRFHEVSLRIGEDALDRLEADLGPDALEVAHARRRLATAMGVAGRHEEGLAQLERAESLLLEHLPANDEEMLGVWLPRASMQGQLGQNAAGLDSIEQAIAIMVEQPDADPFELTRLRVQSASAARNLGELERARHHLDLLSPELAHTDPRADVLFVRGLAQRARIESCLGRWEDAIASWRVLFEYLRGSKGPGAARALAAFRPELADALSRGDADMRAEASSLLDADARASSSQAVDALAAAHADLVRSRLMRFAGDHDGARAALDRARATLEAANQPPGAAARIRVLALDARVEHLSLETAIDPAWPAVHSELARIRTSSASLAAQCPRLAEAPELPSKPPVPASGE